MTWKFDFPKAKGLQTYSAIYVPSTKRKDKKISKKEFDKRITETERFVAKEFGGASAVKKSGIYKIKSGKVVSENIAVVENYSRFSDWKRKDQEIEKFIKKKAGEWEQEAIAFEFESPNSARKLVMVEADKNRLNKVV